MKKILFVDNSPVMLELMTKLVQKKTEHQVFTANDGLEALDFLKNNIPDIIFVDLIMPRIDGKQLCRLIRKMPNLKKVKIAILSGVAAEESLDPYEIGADYLIAKGPFNIMGKFVLDYINSSDTENTDEVKQNVLGLDYVRPREIIQELLSEKDSLYTLMNNISEGILELTADFRIVYISPSAPAMLGIKEDEALGLFFTDLFSGYQFKRVKQISKSIKYDHQEIKFKTPLKIKDKLLAVKLLPVKKQEFRIFVIIMDVTQKVKQEVLLRKSQKMEAIGTLAAGVAHDFNNLLMGIQGYTSLILLDLETHDPYYKMLKSIEQQVESGSKLTGQLLGYARKGKYEVNTLDLNQLIKDTSGTLKRARKQISVKVKLEKELFQIRADKSQIEQVLLNIFINAADAMPEGGILSVKTKNTDHQHIQNALYEVNAGNYILIIISDNGIGMDKITLEHIFDPFFTTKEMGHGTGLGLASAYGIIKGHKGYIEVESKKGRGTTVFVYLPALSSGRKNIEEKKVVRNRENIITGTESVLLVDDEEIVRDVGQKMLMALGYKVFLAESGMQAIEIYNTQKNVIDLIILDMVMPEMGGGQVFDILKSIDPEVVVLLSSGYSLNGEASAIIKRGCKGFIQKPFNLKGLSDKLKQLIHENI